MWLLLKEDISKLFKSEYTYLFPINKNNFFIGKNNSGKSYFSRFLMKNTIKIYKNKSELKDEISDQIRTLKMDKLATQKMIIAEIDAWGQRFAEDPSLLETLQAEQAEAPQAPEAQKETGV